MKTMLDTPEIGREVYGVIWNADQEEPYSHYDSLVEARRVAEATNGYIMFRRVTDWVPLPAHALL